MANFIVDTSVWIDFFRGALGPVGRELLAQGVVERVAGITDVIRHEILVGALSESDYSRLKRLMSPLTCVRMADSRLEAFDRFSWDLRRSGFRGKYTDASIAFICHDEKLPLMTLDRYFDLLAKKGLIGLVSF